MREMQRNQDRAIGQLDVMPGGHNALVRAHQDIADPLMSALSGSNADGTSAIDMDAYSQQAQGAPNNDALPNPWGAPVAPAAPAPATSPAAPPPAASPAPFGMFPTLAAQPQNPAASQSDPMAAMMQQMMSNPAMMQQSMQMASQMFGGQQGAGLGAPSPTPTALPTQAPTATPQDPMAAMMQQMMNNPAMMQQSMQMAQQMFGNQSGNGAGLPGVGFPGMFGAPTVPPTSPAADSDAQGLNTAAGVPAAGTDAFARARFASQLAQLSAMGFCNEAACLRALQQHQGRVDAAIDSLLSSGEGCS